MKWILILYWSLHGQPVLNHEFFEARPPCEERIAALRKVFDYLDHDDWYAICQRATPERPAGGNDAPDRVVPGGLAHRAEPRPPAATAAPALGSLP